MSTIAPRGISEQSARVPSSRTLSFSRPVFPRLSSSHFRICASNPSLCLHRTRFFERFLSPTMAFIPTSAVLPQTPFTGLAVCHRRPAATPLPTRMAYDMDGSGPGSLTPRRIKSSAVEKDSRSFKITFVLPSESRGYTFRELQNVYTTKIVPFSSWYAEQQRIQKMGGKIMKVQLNSGGQMRSVGNT